MGRKLTDEIKEKIRLVKTGVFLKRIFVTCELCGRSISMSNISKHKGSKLCQKPIIDRSLEGLECKCSLCNKIFENKRGLRSHFWRKHTSAGLSHKCKQDTIWNKGLTKETSLSVKKIANSLSVLKKGCPGRKHDEATRDLLSCITKKRYEEFPETHPNRRLAGNRNKFTYPEKVAANWFDSQGISFKHNMKVDRFYPDFVVGSLIIEIDGEEFHKNRKEYDDNRDFILKSYGYKVIRIDAKEHIEDRLIKIFNSHNGM